MPTSFADFEASTKLQRACQDLGLNTIQCRKLEGYLGEICGVVGRGRPKAKRTLSKWQQCIAERRKGKPFDPQAIKELAKEYRAGRCP